MYGIEFLNKLSNNAFEYRTVRYRTIPYRAGMPNIWVRYVNIGRAKSQRCIMAYGTSTGFD